MEVLSLEEVVMAVGGRIVCAGSNTRVERISTDSRNVQKGDLFFALKGERFDGHQYVVQARHAGAVGAVISSEIKSNVGYENFPTIRV